jgi:hypothetical protein
MDADDWAFPQRFEKQLGFAQNKEMSTIYGTQAIG